MMEHVHHTRRLTMAMSDELNKLHELHQRGALSDAEYSAAKARLIGAADAGTAAVNTGLSGLNALRRSRGDRWIAGVCGGIALATGVEGWVWRLLFAVLTLFGGAGLLMYLLLWIFVPSD
jgi:phage shock protein C